MVMVDDLVKLPYDADNTDTGAHATKPALARDATVETTAVAKKKAFQ